MLVTRVPVRTNSVRGPRPTNIPRPWPMFVFSFILYDEKAFHSVTARADDDTLKIPAVFCRSTAWA